jgi:hypothetical protein
MSASVVVVFAIALALLATLGRARARRLRLDGVAGHFPAGTPEFLTAVGIDLARDAVLAGRDAASRWSEHLQMRKGDLEDILLPLELGLLLMAAQKVLGNRPTAAGSFMQGFSRGLAVGGTKQEILRDAALFADDATQMMKEASEPKQAVTALGRAVAARLPGSTEDSGVLATALAIEYIGRLTSYTRLLNSV